MFRSSIAIVAVMSLFPSQAMAAPEAPSGPWQVAYDDERCVASRAYGSGATQRLLVLKPSPSGGVMRIYFIGPGRSEPKQQSGKLRLGSKPDVPMSVLVYGEQKSGQLVAVVNLPMEQFKAHSDAASLGLASGKVSHDLATPGLAKVVTALETCQAELRDIWNLAPAKASLVAEQAVPDRPLQRYFSSSDYPGIALWRQQGGTVVLGLLIDESGGIAECAVESTSGIASLDANSCAIIRERAKFAPARDQSGKAIKSHVIVPISWRVDDDW